MSDAPDPGAALANSIGSVLGLLKNTGSNVGTFTGAAARHAADVGPIENDPLIGQLRGIEKQQVPHQKLQGTPVQSGGISPGGDEANPIPNGPETISQGYGGEGGHPGVDIGVPVGTTLVAAISGTITVASNADPHGYGNYVEITGPNGISVRYGHMSYIGARVGQQIKAGQPIGRSGGAAGAEGSGNSTGPHLHFEVRQGGHSIDPMHFLSVKGNGVVAGTPGDLPATPAGTGEPAPKLPSAQDAVDTALGRTTGILAGKGDPGSENAAIPQTAEATAATPGGASNVDTSNLQGMDKYFAQVLAGVGAPVTPANLAFMRAWQRAEGGDTTNPFNTTQGAPGATNFNNVGVKRYASQQSGIGATVQTLMNGMYGNILQALRNGTDPMAAANALAASPWGTGGLVQSILRG